MTATLLLLALLLALAAAQALGLTHDSRDPDWTLRPASGSFAERLARRSVACSHTGPRSSADRAAAF